MNVKIENLSKNYGSKKALQQVNLEFTPGIYGLLGPNGAGKSTLMNILTGNLDASSGNVYIDGCDIKKAGASYRKRIGYCPQQQTLYPDFTAEQFLFYMASLHGMNRNHAKERVEWALKRFFLYDVRQKKTKSLSGGMKQRLMLAQSVIHDPDILILDEPTAGLDPRQRIAVRNIIGEIAMHKIVLISTHVVSDVEYIAKEIIFLSDGKIINRGTPTELNDQIKNSIWEVAIAEGELPRVSEMGQVCSLAREGERICVKLLADQRPELSEGMSCRPARPNLEDVYLHYFGTVNDLWDTN